MASYLRDPQQSIITSALFLILFLYAGTSFSAEEANRAPLLMQGKKTLYQRVITYPGALRYNAPENSVEGSVVKPFTVLYVYSHSNDTTGTKWLEVAPSSTGQDTFWLLAEKTAEWKQALTLLFTERRGRDPVMFFKSDADLLRVCESQDVKQSVTELQSKFTTYAKDNSAPPSFPLLGMEPSDAQGAVARKRFYVMPIFDWQDPFEGLKFLRVASIDPGTYARGQAPKDENGQNSKKKTENQEVALKTGITFVIDTTVSMKPYIDQSLNVAKKIYDRFEKEGVADRVGLSVVAFRSSTKARSGVEYTSKVISPFKDATKRKDFEEALGQVKEATVSTHTFNEDSFAGLATAVKDLDWSGYHSRIILLITDAGPLEAGDPYASIQMRGQELGDVLRANNIFLVVAHIQTPDGIKNHKYAEAEYANLYVTKEAKDVGYFAIPASSQELAVRSLDKFASAMGTSFVTVIKNADQESVPEKPQAKAPDAPEERGKWLAQTLGYSMQLDYLGDKRGNKAPAVVSSWIADMDLARLANQEDSESVEVALLLTKGQLSALQKQLSLIVENAERTKTTGAKDFFQGVLSASAQMTRDPGRFAVRPGDNLQSLGVLGEFLDGLPYKSQILQMTEEDWNSMNLGQQTQFINRLKSRIARYAEYEKDRDNWESFGAKNSDDWVYRVPLAMLP